MACDLQLPAPARGAWSGHPAHTLPAQPSPRALPIVLPEPEYSPDDRVLRVKANGELRFEGCRLKVSNALYGLPVAARAKDGEDGVFEFWFAHHRIMTLDLRSETQSP